MAIFPEPQASRFAALSRWYRENKVMALCITILMVTLPIAAFYFVTELLSRPVLLLTGPEGSDAENIGEALQLQFSKERAWRLWGRSFQISSHETAGSEANRLQIHSDTDGALVGIAADGFDGANHVRTLLPLGQIPLMIFASQKLRDEIEAKNKKQDAAADVPAGAEEIAPPPGEAPAAPHLTFSKVAAVLKSNHNNVYLGPRGSGTRELATAVLQQYDVAIDQVDTRGDLGFIEAAYALADNHLDLAFFTVQVDAPFCGDLVSHGHASLVDLDQVDGLIKKNDCFFKFALPASTLRAAAPPVVFHTASIQAVLICSDSMPTNDAYWLAWEIRRCLQDHRLLGNTSKSVKNPYPRHPGAQLLQDNEQPWYVAGTRSSVQWFLGAVGGCVGTLTAAAAGRYLRLR